MDCFATLAMTMFEVVSTASFPVIARAAGPWQSIACIGTTVTLPKDNKEVFP
jgi:hypothetical protein